MKILVYGAGVLGSYLAYELSAAGHEIFLLARGNRYDTLKAQGLIVEHHTQKKTTKSQVVIVNTFAKTDEYDAVFVVMQKTQIDAVLPTLAANEKCKFYVLVGNNGQIEKTYADFMSMSPQKPTVLFGFLGSGGRNENGRIISIHKKKVDFVIGDMTKKIQYKDIIGKIFAATNIVPWCCDNIDAWFKYHLAIVLPLCYAVHSVNGDMKKLAKSKRILHLTIQAVKEGAALLEHLGYPLEPASLNKLLKCPGWLMYLPIKLAVQTKTVKLAVRDHAMAAIGEMNQLTNEFVQLKSRAQMKTPALDELATYLIRL